MRYQEKCRHCGRVFWNSGVESLLYCSLGCAADNAIGISTPAPTGAGKWWVDKVRWNLEAYWPIRANTARVDCECLAEVHKESTADRIVECVNAHARLKLIEQAAREVALLYPGVDENTPFDAALGDLRDALEEP